MKKFIFSFVCVMASWMGANAMSFERAQAEALYLTDKMAYELNLNEQQYNDAYEINLDYFLRIDSPSDVYGSYYSYRLNDFRHILHDWQYSMLVAADYFLRPIVWRAGGWHFPIYSYYNRGYYYYSRPRVWVSYYGGHGRAHYRDGYYVNRRPHWDGGLRGRDMHRPSASYHHSSPATGSQHRSGGSSNYGGVNGYRSGSGNSHGGNNHSGMNSGSNHGSNYGGNHGGMSRGNSFDGSSSRMSGGSRGGSNYGGSSRSSSPGMSGSSRGGSFGGSHSSGMSRGGGMGGSRSGGGGGGVSRSGRR